MGKKTPKENTPCQVFVNNNARFCYQSKERVLFSNTFERMQMSLVVNLIMLKRNMTMKMIMTNLTNNLLKAKKDNNNKSNK